MEQLGLEAAIRTSGRIARGAIVAAALCAAGAGVASADTFTLANSNGGDGYVVTGLGTFDLFGADNGASANATSYLATAGAAKTLTFNWSYTTADCCGSAWDPAGYILNGVMTQLSTDSYVTGAIASSGTLTLNLAAGDSYGFYVYSPDSIEGRGEISVSSGISTVPLPAGIVLLSGAFGLLGAAKRKARKA